MRYLRSFTLIFAFSCISVYYQIFFTNRAPFLINFMGPMGSKFEDTNFKDIFLSYKSSLPIILNHSIWMSDDQVMA